MFDLELDRVVKWIGDGGFSSVAVQLPEGLKIRAPEISDYIESRTGASVLIIGRPCYGACDLFDYKGSDVELDEDRIKAVLEPLPGRVGILATIQYIDLIPGIRGILESMGRTTVVGTGDRRIMYPGQVLGCNCTAAESVSDKADCFIYIGEGDFHPLAAAFGAGKPVYVLNPMTCELRDMSDARDRMIRRRFGIIQIAAHAERFLIIICSKVGQCRRDTAKEAEDMIKAAGRICITAVMEEVTPDSLASYCVDAYVCTACPRIATDDSARYGKPMLTVPELEIALGLKEWTGYPFDQIRG